MWIECNPWMKHSEILDTILNIQVLETALPKIKHTKSYLLKQVCFNLHTIRVGT